ncbi:MAG: hypothetical protein WBC04_24600 [Candidatus Acidiferrales bacterium]|jgi:hypothetical protein
MRLILLGAVCPNNLCVAFLVPLLHRTQLDFRTMSRELECPFCHTVFRTPDNELTPREVSADWIKRAMQARDARITKSGLVQKALGGELSSSDEAAPG